jgi:hypothetical protein
MSIISRLVDRITGRDPDAPPRLPSPDALVLLTRPQGEPEAELLKGILEQEGIRSMVKNRDAQSARAGGMGPPWAYELWVLRKDLARARELIDADPDQS